MSALLSVVIPCYNEALNLPALIQRVNAALDACPEAEFVLVNNGSRDNSTLVLDRLVQQAADPRISVHSIDVNQGYGHGILAGLRVARGTFVGWTHADMQCDPLDAIQGMKKMLAEMGPERVLLKGRRVDRLVWDAFFTWAMGWVASLVLQCRLEDVNAQPKLFHRSLLEKMKNAPGDFSLDLYVLWLAKTNKFKIIELPVYFEKRRYGEAKGGGAFMGKLKLSIRTWRYILSLRKSLACQ